MGNVAEETIWKIVLAVFTIVLLPLLYSLLKPVIEELVDRWRYRRTKAMRLVGKWKDKCGYVYHMTALLYLEPCEHTNEDHEVTGMIESEIIAFPDEFAEKYPKYPHGSIAFEIVRGHCDKKLVLQMTTQATTDTVLVPLCTYTISISKDRKSFTGTSCEIGTGRMGEWEGTARVR